MSDHAPYRLAPSRRRALAPAIVAAFFVLAIGSASRVTADDAFQCGLAPSTGIAPADAETATRLVCDELRKASGGRGAFDVRLATLGKAVLLTATRADSRFSVTVQLDGVEELPVAAGRVARALVQGQPFSRTERVDNLIASETRQPLSKKGSVKFSLGVAHIESPGHGGRGSGFGLGLAYTAPRFALPADMRFGWDDTEYGGKQLSLFSLSVGGRAYLTTRDTSPFLGAGLGYVKLSASEGAYPMTGDPRSSYFSGERSGIAPYLEAGVEMLRTHRGRIALHVRADLPTAAVRSQAVEVYSYDQRTGASTGLERVVPEQSRYVVPVTIALSVTF
jgi:opacity protein-like surface antigen